MQLVKWSPWREMNSLDRHFNSIWDDFFYPGMRHGLKEKNWHPAVDVYENESHIIIKAELPGIDKDDVSLDVKGRVLSLSGERRENVDAERDCAQRRERFFGRFERTFTLPTEVNVDKIHAEYKDGVLTIEVPKPEKEMPKQITIH